MFGSGICLAFFQGDVPININGPAPLTPPRDTGLVCSACERPVALIENKLPRTLVFHCPACGHWWSVDEPGTPKQ
jgi:hypothetical protein